MVNGLYNTLHIHYITIGFSHQLCYMFQSNQSNESISMSCMTRKKHLPTLKNVIVALPQVEFVLLVTKAGATWEAAKNWGVPCLHEEWIGMCCLERVLDLDEIDINILINHHSSIYLRWIGLLFRTQGPKNHWCC